MKNGRGEKAMNREADPTLVIYEASNGAALLIFMFILKSSFFALSVCVLAAIKNISYPLPPAAKRCVELISDFPIRKAVKW